MREVQVRILVPEYVCRACVWVLLLHRRLRYGYPFRRIPLTQGKFAIVDPGDYERLAKYKWFALRCGRGFYAARALRANERRSKGQHMRMHRQIIDVPPGKFIDHINHNGLDNRRANLRIVTTAQNNWNKPKHSRNCTSKYKGLTWSRTEAKWQVRISCKGRRVFIGYFDDEKAAARAYDAKAAELFGEYAALNFGGV